MKKVVFKVLIAVVAAFLLAASSGFLLFKVVERRVVSRMRAPKLKVERKFASDLVFRTLDGQPRRLSESKGKVVFLDLWGTWCVQCVAEMPKVQALYDHYRSDPDVTFLVVSRLDTPQQVRAYARRNNFSLPFYLMRDEDIPKTMRLDQFPSTFLYAKDGSMVVEHVGAADWADSSVVSLIDRLKQQ
ncbi:TlpA family protein disulfide reductase [Edaphobacter aggregans]|uniref:TlpA family protein disulfide reductase n=1 Tax=Edaphobacter aggregans TaxID=570835 RepID=UPI00068C5587|nr:TlpA disulfide reductase family protein [Edaphobacter aggregans]